MPHETGHVPPRVTAGVLIVSRDATLGRHLVQRCGGARRAEAVTSLQQAGDIPRDAVVVVATRPSWDFANEAIARARARFPLAALLLFLRRDAVSGAMIEAARQARVDYVAIEGIDDVAGRLPFACRRTQARLMVARALEPIIAAATPNLRRVLRLAIARAAEPTSVSGAARMLGVHRKTLFVWCREARLGIGPHGALAWPRILLAARMLDQRSTCIQAVALELGFPSGAALGATMRRLIGRSPSELASRGAFATALECFHASMQRAWSVAGRGPACRPGGPKVTTRD